MATKPGLISLNAAFLSYERGLEMSSLIRVFFDCSAFMLKIMIKKTASKMEFELKARTEM